MTQANAETQRLGVLVGEWSIETSFGGPAGRMTIEWILGGQYLLQRFEVPVPEAPDGFCIIGYHPHRGSYFQHYFDSRGVARVYVMSFDREVWKLQRDEEDFSELSFHQRYEGRLSDDGRRIDGAWHASRDGGETWEKDFDLVYVRLPVKG